MGYAIIKIQKENFYNKYFRLWHNIRVFNYHKKRGEFILSLKCGEGN